MDGRRFGITVGVFADPIGDQLREQGIETSEIDAEFWQRLSDALTLLKIHGIITDGESDKAGNRLVKRIAQGIKRHLKGGES